MGEVYMGPQEGIMESHSRRDIIEKVAENTGWNPSGHEYSHGRINWESLYTVLEEIGFDTEGFTLPPISEEPMDLMREELGIQKEKYQGDFNAFDRDDWWKIWEAVKEVKNQ
jgi:hypothetical protein